MTWPLRALQPLCELAIDCVNKTAPVVDYVTPYKMIRTSNISGGFIDLENVRYVEASTFKKWTRRSKPRCGDVILTREAPVGRVGRYTSHDECVFLGQRLFHYRPNPELLDWRYLAYVLQSDAIQGWLHGIAFGATVPHIKVEDAEKLKIPYPPLNIQKRIGTVLATYDDLIENNLRRIKLLEEQARLIYEEWFVRLKFPGHEQVPLDSESGLPEGWEKPRLRDVLELKYGRALKADVRKPGSIPVFGSAGVVGSHSDAITFGPGIILGRKGSVGSLYWSESDFFPIDTVYFVETQRSLYLVYYAMKYQEYVNNDSAVPGLSRNAVYAKTTVWPTLDVEIQFEDRVKPMFDLIDNLKQQNRSLENARDILLPRLMTGMIDVDEIDVPKRLFGIHGTESGPDKTIRAA